MNNLEVTKGANSAAAAGSKVPRVEKVCFLTLGCKLNQCESEELRRRFLENGFRPVEDVPLADTVFVSTCGVTARAEQKSRQAVGHILALNPRAKVVVAGCAVQRFPESFAQIPGVALALGSSERMNPFPHLQGGVRKAVSSIDSGQVAAASGAPQGRTRALLKIQDGCSANCTYCVVPQSRGSSRSVPPNDVLASVKKLAGSGYREIVLSGVNVGDYGRGLDDWNLSRLIDELSSLPIECRIRLSSLEPWTVTPELVRQMISNDRICPHLHLPLQSGCTATLRRMGRPYDRADLDAILETVAAAPGTGLGADVIVGFPGESDDDFQHTVNVIEKYPFSYLHVFPFSRRPGTPACDFPNQLRTAEITRRAKILRGVGEKKKAQFLSNLTGTTQSVLMEHKFEGEYHFGTSANYVKIKVKGDLTPGRIYPIKITFADNKSLVGELIT
jgi:threonylcarbamoyladenosine tRNA methylthiotransferase MtaB